MSLEAAIGRIDQIYSYQQALLNPASLAAQASASASTGGTSSTTPTGATFADQLASAQDTQSAGSTTAADGVSSSDGLSPDASSALPTATAASGLGATTGLSGLGATTGLSGLGATTGATGVGATNGLSAAAKMLAAAQAATGGAYSQANHNAVGDTASQIRQLGTDCSGFVSYLMGPNGIGAWSQSYATPGIPTAPNVEPGKGSYVTIYNNPNPGDAGHVWIEILGQYFESSGSGGVHQMSQGEVNQYLSSGQYQPFHPTGM